MFVNWNEFCRRPWGKLFSPPTVKRPVMVAVGEAVAEVVTVGPLLEDHVGQSPHGDEPFAAAELLEEERRARGILLHVPVERAEHLDRALLAFFFSHFDEDRPDERGHGAGADREPEEDLPVPLRLEEFAERARCVLRRNEAIVVADHDRQDELAMDRPGPEAIRIKGLGDLAVGEHAIGFGSRANRMQHLSRQRLQQGRTRG